MSKLRHEPVHRVVNRISRFFSKKCKKNRKKINNYFTGEAGSRRGEPVRAVVVHILTMIYLPSEFHFFKTGKLRGPESLENAPIEKTRKNRKELKYTMGIKYRI